MPLNPVFLADLTLVALSVYTAAGLIVSIDGTAVQQRLNGAVPEKAGGAVLASLDAVSMERIAAWVVHALLNRAQAGAGEVAFSITGFLLAPTYIIGGVLLWRRHALGMRLAWACCSKPGCCSSG